MPKFIYGTAPEGRKTPIAPSDGTDPATGGILMLEPGRVTRIAYSQDVRRAIARGDILTCNMEGATVSLEGADAPDALDNGPHVSEADHENADKKSALATLSRRRSDTAQPFDTSDSVLKTGKL